MRRSEFDRVRPRSPTAPSPASPRGGKVDTQGRRALFSTDAPTPAFGSVALTCSSCHQTAVLTYRQTARALLPSVYLPLPRRSYPSLLRCPSCSRLTWQRLRVRF